MNNLKSDFPASIVVFFVALPLCLGIALASGAPLISGLIAGIVGGVVVGTLSGSQIGVSGPAAGLATIVYAAIEGFGGIENGFEIFLVAVVFGGLLQLIAGNVDDQGNGFESSQYLLSRHALLGLKPASATGPFAQQHESLH